MVGTTRLKQDELVEKLFADAATPADVRPMIGFLGKSAREGHWRLHATVLLDEYIEFAEADVVHQHTFEPDGRRIGGTVIWIRRDANVQHTKSGSREAQAEFLRGEIAAGSLASPSFGGMSPLRRGIDPWLQAACLTGGDFDTLCAACSAVPTALLGSQIRNALGLEP
jgi:hypothetical protein